MPKGKLKHFIVSNAGGDWHCRPSSRFATLWLGLLIVNGLLMAAGGMYLDYWRLRNNQIAFTGFPNLFAVIGSLTAFLLWGIGVWYWWYRNVPLVIEKSGRMRLGTKVVCEPRNVQAVVLREPSDIDDDSGYFFNFRLLDGSVLELGSPCFQRIGKIEVAKEMAEEVAKALNAKLVTITKKS